MEGWYEKNCQNFEIWSVDHEANFSYFGSWECVGWIIFLMWMWICKIMK